jgi:hypothetical protein
MHCSTRHQFSEGGREPGKRGILTGGGLISLSLTEHEKKEDRDMSIVHMYSYINIHISIPLSLMIPWGLQASIGLLCLSVCEREPERPST